MEWRSSAAPKRQPPGFIEPCIPTLASQPPVGSGWVHEIKHDGYRLIARKRDGRVRLFTRRGYDWTHKFPLIVEAMGDLNAGKKLPPVVDNPQAGAAEVLYGLGAALGRRGGEDLGLIYLQLALYLVPSHPLALLSLGDLYESLKKPELANKIYERVPLNSSLQRNAQIQLAMNLDTLERTDDAKALLEKLITAHPGDLEAIMALGNVLRGR